jgi:hypothetical protein
VFDRLHQRLASLIVVHYRGAMTFWMRLGKFDIYLFAVEASVDDQWL